MFVYKFKFININTYEIFKKHKKKVSSDAIKSSSNATKTVSISNAVKPISAVVSTLSNPLNPTTTNVVSTLPNTIDDIENTVAVLISGPVVSGPLPTQNLTESVNAIPILIPNANNATLEKPTLKANMTFTNASNFVGCYNGADAPAKIYENYLGLSHCLNAMNKH